MASLRIWFDKDGNHKETDFIPSDSYYRVSAENGVLKDNAIFCYGFNPPANLFTGQATCFDILNQLNASVDIPDWVTYTINTDKSTVEAKSQSMATSSGFRQMYSFRYDRTTTFGVLPQSENGTFRQWSFCLVTGYHVGTIDDNNGWRQEGYSYDSYLQVTIYQDGFTRPGIAFSNPYYTTKKDDIVVEEKIEVEGVAHIYIQVKANGGEYSCNKLSLAAKHYNYNYPESPYDGDITILDPSTPTNLHIEGVPNWVQYEIENLGNNPNISIDDFIDIYPFYAWLNLKFAPNTTSSPRDTVIDIHHTDDIESSYYVKYEIHITQEGVEDSPDEPVETSSLEFKSAQLKLPATASTEVYNTVFYYENAVNFRIEASESWLTLGTVTANDGTGVLPITWSENTKEFNRTGTVTLYADSTIDNSLLQTTIAVTQAAKGTGGDKPEEEDTTGDFIIVDNNTGEDYDSTSLLFKDNPANIYSTLEAKDNTLFLGNYLNTDFSLQIYNSIGSLTSIGVHDTRISVPLALSNSSTYAYTPNMKLNSQEKRLFKKGETYSLGLVFVRKNGVKSTVFYVGDYSPSADPSIGIEDMIYKMTKPQAYVTLSSTKLSQLRNIGVIGVIPVCAQRGSHKVICQGFLNPTISSRDRKSTENLTAQYNWFQRLKINNTDTAKGEEESTHSPLLPEFQARNDDDVWTFNNSILTLNTPEVEANDFLTDAELEGCTISSLWKSTVIDYINSVQLNVNGKYLHSRAVPPLSGYRTDRRETSIGIWHGYVDKGTIKETDAAFIADTKEDSDTNYKTFYVYPWQRNTVGGEGPDSTIISKKFFTSLYIKNTTPLSEQLGIVSKASIYRDTFPALLKFDNNVYQGNVDYIINITKPYKAFMTQSYVVEGTGYTYPRAHPDVGVYAGYNTSGEITDPIYMRYKTAPHIALYFSSPYTSSSEGVVCAELSHPSSTYVFENDPQVLSSLTWIKCGDVVPLGTSATSVYFTEGDYFYGRFDSLRTYPYSQDDVNSVTDIVSGMLCSRVNLDARCDRNRGVGTALVTPENFNRFNSVYDQSNNYFTYQYFNLTDKVYERKYSNSIQWSMTKAYGNEVDDWCNIQEANTLDLDGDKGKLSSLQRFNNNIIAFQDSGISQILYNESMQVASTEGVPIEIANSGKVNGKRYLYETIGCQDERAIATTPNGLYFIDAINKSLYRLGSNGNLDDLCITGGMKSWGLSNIDNAWKCWYDLYAQEVVFTNPSTALLYSDIFSRFQCFASYNSIEDVFSLNGRTYLFKKTISPSSTYQNLWQRNAQDNSVFFSIQQNVEVEIVANPEPTVDKTFTNIEYRADGFKNNIYSPNASFNSLRVQNEYQDTGVVSLENIKDKPSNLKKKFRMWHVDIPRSINPKFLPTISEVKRYIEGDDDAVLSSKVEAAVPSLAKIKRKNTLNTTSLTSYAASPSVGSKELNLKTRDRIRNPWCNIRLATSMKDIDKFIVHDIQVQYM